MGFCLRIKHEVHMSDELISSSFPSLASFSPKPPPLTPPPPCSCYRTPRPPRARWWFWSAGSEEALLCRSDGTVRARRSWTPPISGFSRKVRPLIVI